MDKWVYTWVKPQTGGLNLGQVGQTQDRWAKSSTGGLNPAGVGLTQYR